MARKKLIAGNWKMNGLLEDGVALAKGVAQEVKAFGKSDCEFLVCPPFTLLASVKKALRGAKVALGAQDVHFAEKGAHTGDISPLMLKDLGCSYVIVGHSERRADHFETDELVCKKTAAAHAAGLKAVICIGETEAQRDAGKTIEVCSSQILGSVPEDSTAADTVIAYEPVWAIGTGKTASAEQAQEIHAYIRTILREKFGAAADETPILYGGSCKPSNAPELFAKEDVDGGLIGGAALKAADFLAIGKGFPQK